MIFNIKKNRHYSDGLLYKLINLFHDSDRMAYSVTFNDTAIYYDETLDKFDVNKLFGFSIGFHHINSYRFGWNSHDGQIHIYAYSYVKGERIIQEICCVEIDKEYKFLIRIKNGKIIFTIIDENHQIKQSVQKVSSSRFFGYCLWPYFGGNKTAPKNISIELNEF